MAILELINLRKARKAILYLVLIGTHWLTKYLGQTSLYIIRKFFGIIVLAIACKLMFGNLATIF